MAISSKIADARILWPSNSTPVLDTLKKLSHIYSWRHGLLWSAPDYLSDVIFYNSSSHSICFNCSGLLIPGTHQAHSYLRAFGLAVSSAWIAFPQGMSMVSSSFPSMVSSLFPSSFYWNVNFSLRSS